MGISEINKKYNINLYEYRELYYKILEELYFDYNPYDDNYDITKLVKDKINNAFYPLTYEYYISKEEYNTLKNKDLLQEVYYLISNPLVIY